ncbi:MAG: hypothetical protein P8076_08445 [Gammaproteobacteria bacterium]
MDEQHAGEICLRGGSLYLQAAVCARHFPGIHAVALWRDDRRAYLIPLATAGTGGYLLKIRNARGDRVIHCPEFIEGLQLALDAEVVRPLRWDVERHALVFALHD